VRNSSLVKRSGVDNVRDLNYLPKLWTLIYQSGRGTFYGRRSCVARHGEAHRKANVGISNDNLGEKPGHRKSKVS
jgi:hypothetical protein